MSLHGCFIVQVLPCYQHRQYGRTEQSLSTFAMVTAASPSVAVQITDRNNRKHAKKGEHGLSIQYGQTFLP